MADRWRVAAAVAASYLLAFAPLLLSGSAGLWWARILMTTSWPLALLACAVSFVFRSSIIRRPLPWAICALVTAVGASVSALYIVTHSWAGLASIFIAAPAVAVFYVLARVWLQRVALEPKSSLTF